LLAYASAWFKLHYPAAFVTALLNNQPMGFYHPSTLVKDAQRRGVRFHPVDVQASAWECTVEADGAVRLGLRYVNGLREEIGRALVAVRVRSASPRQAPGFSSLDDLVARTGLRRDEMATLADIGALNAFGGHRRSALWQAEQAVRPAGALFENWELGNSQFHESPPSPLPPMTDVERLVADYAGTGLTLGRHPMSFCRDHLALRGVLRALDLRTAREGRRVRVAGMVITRQRPGTAKGFLFLTLEDETGVANIIVRPDLFARDRLILVQAPFLLVDGILQNQEGVTSVRAEAVQAMPGPLAAVDAHDFH
jgi:error-prone DNA polymerase